MTNKKEIVGTAYRQDGNLQNLKKEIVGGTNERATFMEIYEVNMDGHRIVAFQIPPATRGIPRTWNGAAYAREDENYKSSANGQGGLNKKSGWSRLVQRIVEGATFEDLDPEAVPYAKLYVAESTFSYYNTHR